jgi:CelD/BcsL family acetyltransferase involved in cellulose biosynthesis
MNSWQLRDVPFNFQLGDLSLFKVSVPLQVRSERLVDNTAPVRAADAPSGELAPGSEGFVIRALPLAEPAPLVSSQGAYLCYVPQQYEHCYIDLTMGFERYQAKFSSKTRSTIMRKLRKFAELSGGTIDWKTYRTEAEIDAFFDLAVSLSKTTYQDRLLDAGLPDSAEFRRQALQLAQRDSVRAFILFKEGKPVSYLFCPIDEGVLTYSYVGYDPAHMNLSVGTVLQWLAIEQLFGEAKFRYFDFTEGQSDHKRLFATDRRLCGNVFLLRHSLRHRALVYCHQSMDRFSRWLGKTMERYGIKAHVKRLLRFGR